MDRLNEFEIEFDAKVKDLEEQIRRLKEERPVVVQQVAAKGQPAMLNDEEEEEVAFQSNIGKKNKPTAVRSAAPPRKKVMQMDEYKMEDPKIVQEEPEVVEMAGGLKKAEPVAVRSGAPPSKPTKKDEQAPPAAASKPKNNNNVFGDDMGLDDLEDIPMLNDAKNQKVEPTAIPETPQRFPGDAQPQPFELPTPSSTSKLEKVQPIDNVGLSFTPPPQYQGVTQSQPRAARYESQEPENEEQVSKYSDDYEEPQETTVLNAPS